MINFNESAHGLHDHVLNDYALNDYVLNENDYDHSILTYECFQHFLHYHRFFYDHGYIFILACDRVCDLGHDRVCGRVYDHVYGHDHVNSFCDHVLAFHHQLKIFFLLILLIRQL